MAKTRSVFVCSDCGAQSPKWQGQCVDCGAWNTLSEMANQPRHGGRVVPAGPVRARPLGEVGEDAEGRQTTGLGEFDRVLGGGLVAGSVSLIGGDPGIGKSTLLLQAAAKLAERIDVLYVSGEESLSQISMRARRLGVDGERLALLAETSLERILPEILASRAQVVVIDSVQTVYTDALQSAPGTVSQLRECAGQIVQLAKQNQVSVFLVGHVTKEGVIAGPRVLEHMVDTVLYFESDAGSRHRIVRAAKNRFGAANEIGVFAMTDSGLKEVRNPSALFLSRHDDPVAGSVIMVTREGTRPLLVEVQALTSDSQFGTPRRLAVGPDQNRLAMLLAVLQRHGQLTLAAEDVFVNVVGGVRITETAVDLPLLLAVQSSFRDRPVAPSTVAFGEVGLAGEIRPVPFGEERLAAAAKHGFQRALVPSANRPRKAIAGLEVLGVDTLQQALDA